MGLLERVDVRASDGSRIGRRRQQGAVITRRRTAEEQQRVGISVVALPLPADSTGNDHYMVNAQRGRGPNVPFWKLQWLPVVLEHLKRGEGYEEALFRGLREELGLRPDEGYVYGLDSGTRIEGELTVPMGRNRTGVMHARFYVAPVEDLDEVRAHIKSLSAKKREIIKVERKRVERVRDDLSNQRGFARKLEQRAKPIELVDAVSLYLEQGMYETGVNPGSKSAYAA